MNVMRPPPVQPHVGESRWGSNEHAMQHQQPQLATSPSGSGSTDHMSPGKGSKAKDLSHVPCKFFRANTCTAGKACPFSHDLPVPGTTKPICQWFAKGNCKFGHKCALAHVLPGQPMSFDRKNKRAAQQALRDAQAAANGGHLPPQAGTSPQGHQNGSGLTQTLRQSGDNTDMTAYYLAQREQLIAKANAHAAATAGANFQDGVFGSPDSTHTPATSPQMQGRGLPHEMNHAPLHFAAIARGATATFVAPPASGLSHHFGSPPSSSGRSTVAAQAMLSEQARRLSNTSDSLSPPRLQHLSRTRLSYNGGGNGLEYGTSPPLAVPGTNGGGGVVSPSASTGGGIFGTSPFSSSRGLFMPSSYDSNEDGFPRSPPMRHATLPGDGMYRTTSSGASWRNAAAIDDGDDDNGEDFDEGFLPSSLNDLLTPEEMRRRTMRAQGAHGSAAYGPSSVSSRNAFDFMSNSVPADLLLATGSPIASSAAAAAAALKTSIPVPSLGARSMSAMSPSEWPPIGSSSPPRNGSFLAQSRTREATLVAAVPPTINSAGRVVSPATASLLSSALSGVRPPPQPPQSPSTQQSSPHLVAPVAVSSGATYGMYSASFSGGPVLPSAAQLNGVSSTSPPTADAVSTLHKSSSLASELAGIAAPGSLPTGLAAGLSRLHLVPPAHTGETPPSLAGSYFGSNNAAPAAVSSPFGGSHVAPPDSGVGLTTVGSPLRSELQHHSLAGGGDQTSSAAATSDGARRSSETASSGGRADDEEEHADEGDVEIQFDLEGAMFHPETPSRVLRRIDDLNQLSLPDLPDLPAELPSFSETTDADSTVAHSPAKGSATPVPRAGRSDTTDGDRENRDPLVDAQQTPYTSTPATSSLYTRSEATVVPHSAQSRAGNDTTATLRAPLPQARSPRVEESENSFDAPTDTASESEAEAGTGFQDEMVVMSGGSGGEEEEEDDDDRDHHATERGEMRHAPVASMELSALPDVRPVDETTADSEIDSPRHSRTGEYRSAGEEEAEIPTTKPSYQHTADEHRLLPDSLSPLRDREPTEASIESVEIGRHASPQTSPHASLSRYDADATPSRAFSKSPSPAFQPETPKLDSPLASIRNDTALSTPRVDQSAAQRRAAHVLTTLRSTAKPRLARGTPHPVRTASKKPALVDEDEQASVSSIASDRSSNDLTTFHKGNTSLPSGGSAAAEIGPGGSRFDGAKLNSYLHALNTQLTDENQSLVQTLQKTAREKELLQAETRRLEDTIREMSVTQGAISFDASARERTRADDSDLRDDIGTLKAQLEATATERDALRSELAKLGGAFPAADSSLAGRGDIIAELEQKDAELETVRKQMEEQEAEFAQKMEDLECELCKVMEEQEAKVEQARCAAEEHRREDEVERQADREKIRQLEIEREELQRRHGGGDDDESDAEHADRASLKQQLAELNDLVSNLRNDVEHRDDELVKMQEELDTAEERIAELEQQVAKSDEDGAGDVATLRQQLAQKDEEIKQLEDALDDSAQQLVDNETVLADKEAAVAGLKADLEAEQEKRASLETRLSQLSVPKAKSPLANEVYNGANQEQIAALEEELEAARRDADDLRKKLAEVSERERLAKLDELEVQRLEADKANLEDRVRSLRQQVSSPYSPSKTPDKSWGLRPLPAVFTPRTPGQIFGNLSTWSNGNAADETISPLLAQIHELEQVVDHLQAQLGEANVAIDSKLNKLEAAGSSTISLARQLSDARARIAQLEDDLERLLGNGGSLERVQARLAKLTCPECKSAIDANRLVRLHVDRSGITFAEDSSPAAASSTGPSLKVSLAQATARVDELQVENQVLQAAVTRSSEVVAEKEKLVRQREELERHLKLLRDEMAVLETDLRTERSRLRNLTSEHTLAGKARAALEARLATAEAELRYVKRELASAGSPAELDRLRAEKSQLQGERTDLLRQLAEVKAHASQVVSDLSASRADDAALRQQLERHVTEIRQLREQSHAKDAEKRQLQDERNDILRGVANLQADLNRVRQEVITLGLEIAAVRKERDDLSKRNKGDDDELVRAAHQLALAEAKVKELQSGLRGQSAAPPPDVVALQAKHKSEMKGLLVLSRQLKIRLEREATFRYEAGLQKRYLEDVLRGKQETIDTVFSHLHIEPPTSGDTGRRTLRTVALSVIAVHRMGRLAAQWRERSAPKKRLREKAYPAARGHPFPE